MSATMSVINGSEIKIKVNGENVKMETCHYYSNDKVTITLIETIEEKQFNKWSEQIGNEFSLSINESYLKASGKYKLTRVGCMVKMESPVKVSLVFKK
jgi:hypothetical protein